MLIALLVPSLSAAFMSEKEIVASQAVAGQWPVGDRIAFWAERFVGTPYDPDPLGEYVRKNVVIADERVDCMYLTFRVVELSFSRDEEGAVRIALDKRFPERGILQNGKIVNYKDRFQYGEDMLDSGKWGREITGELGGTLRIAGSRGRPQVRILSRGELQRGAARLRNGDLVFFVRDPARRLSDEIVGHIGIIRE
ncbi:MAG: hypothetical protein M0024_09200, partial [Nitrospiraceae bacterium]|nr:hypothetical protein [Nitrospiraceae bacterium]